MGVRFDVDSSVVGGRYVKTWCGDGVMVLVVLVVLVVEEVKGGDGGRRGGGKTSGIEEEWERGAGRGKCGKSREW